MPPDVSSKGRAPDERGRLFKLAALTAVAWAFLLLVLVALLTDGLSRAVAGVGGLIGVAVGILTLFQDRLKAVRIPRIDRVVWTGLVVLTLAVEATGSAGWAGWAYHRATRSIDVTAHVGLRNNRGVLPGDITDVDMDIPQFRRRLAITVNVADRNPEQGTCTPETLLRVTPAMNGNQGISVTAAPNTPILIPLNAGATHVHLDLLVVNDRQDKNCAVDLSVPRAVLKNG